MSDPRSTPANPRVVARAIAQPGESRLIVDPVACFVARPLVDLLRQPDGLRDRQLVYGEAVDLLEDAHGWACVQAAKDGYVGYVPADTLVPAKGPPSHVVSARTTHAYAEADLKSPDQTILSFGSRIVGQAEQDGFVGCALGWIPAQHLQPLPWQATNPLDTAKLFLGTPYLWGGNSGWGIDCSGLVQAALLSCGVACPGDSDQQMAQLGPALRDGTPPRSGDLFFWAGHVAMVADDTRLIHANAHHMAVTYEDITSALDRIAAAGTPLLTHIRP